MKKKKGKQIPFHPPVHEFCSASKSVSSHGSLLLILSEPKSGNLKVEDPAFAVEKLWIDNSHSHDVLGHKLCCMPIANNILL